MTSVVHDIAALRSKLQEIERKLDLVDAKLQIGNLASFGFVLTCGRSCTVAKKGSYHR